ncbi:MAG: DUF4124 domain-containing protein [Rhodanobacteraceae bacterium]
MKPLVLLLVLLAAITAALTGECAEQVYAWTDSGGVKHFSDSPPPPGVKDARRLTIQGGTTASANPPVADQSTPPAEETTQAASNQPVGNDAASRAKACSTARSNLKLLQSDYQISMPNGADGKPQVLDKQRRNLEIARANEQVAFFCK